MKKTIALIICILALALVFTCCGSKKTGGETTADTAVQTDDAATDTGADESSDTEDTAYPDGYIPPESAIEIDMTADDPSTDEVSFIYDSDGRIIQCSYELDGENVSVNYTYDDDNNLAHLFVFKGAGALVDDKTIELPGAFDPDAGFSLIDGYYFKGYAK